MTLVVEIQQFRAQKAIINNSADGLFITIVYVVLFLSCLSFFI